MSDKRAKNLTFPVPVIEEFDRISSGLNAKQKWIVASAAIIAFLELSEAERGFYQAQVSGADVGDGGFAQLIEHAKSGQLREELARRKLPPTTVRGTVKTEDRPASSGKQRGPGGNSRLR